MEALIISELVSQRWDSRYGIIQIRSKSLFPDWVFIWNHRSANALADRIAKVSLDSNLFLFLEFPTLTDLPFDFADAVFADCMERYHTYHFGRLFCALMRVNYSLKDIIKFL